MMAGRFSIEAIFEARDRMTAPVSRMQTRLGRFTRGVERGLRRANAAAQRMSKSLGAGLRRVGVAAGAAGAAVGLAVNGMASDADALIKESRRLKFPIDELQTWRFAMEQGGVTAQQFSKNMGAFTKRLGEARNGSGALHTTLSKQNPALLEQLKNTESISDALDLYIKAMRDTKGPANQAAMASAAFSRQGLNMIDITKMSTEEIAALRAEQERNGVITKEQAEAAERYNDTMNSMRRAITGVRNDAIAPLLPILTDAAERVREWAVENRGLISERLKGGLEWLVDNFSTIVTWLRRIGIALVVFYTLTTALKVATAAVGAFNFVIALNPIVLIALGIMAAVAAFALLLRWVWKSSDDFVALGRTVLDWVLAPFRWIGEAFESLPGPAKVAIAILMGPIGWLIGAGLAIVRHWGGIKEFFADLWGGITDTFDAALAKVLGVVDRILGAVRRVTGAARRVAGFFGFGGDDTAEAGGGGATAGGPQVVTQGERTSRSITESLISNQSEVTIRDDTGRAEVTGGTLGGGVNLVPSGSF